MQNTLIFNSDLQTFDCKEIMPLESNFFWLLKEGIVKTSTWSEEGSIITLGYWGSNDVVGQPLSLVDPYQIECLTTVKASCIPVNQSYRLADAIRRHIQQTEELLYIVRSERMYHRLYKILVWLAHKFGREVATGKLIDLRLTHQDLAEIIGTTRVTITKLINQLEKERIISRPERNTIVLCNRL
ncbi:MAG: Crp/Fnr family transcriptional regulator [Pleurocapsa sp.]